MWFGMFIGLLRIPRYPSQMRPFLQLSPKFLSHACGWQTPRVSDSVEPSSSETSAEMTGFAIAVLWLSLGMAHF